MTKYEIILYWSVDDDAFIGDVPELPGCAADGPTRQAAPANAEIVIQEWIGPLRNWVGLYPNQEDGSCSPDGLRAPKVSGRPAAANGHFTSLGHPAVVNKLV